MKKELRHVMTTQGVELKPMFRDFDKTNRGYITRHQFERVLTQQHLKPRTGKIISLLLKKYMNNGNLVDVNYADFIRDIDIPDERYLIYENVIDDEKAKRETILQNEQKNATKYISLAKAGDLDDVLGKIRELVKMNRLRLAEFCRDYDKLRKGVITHSQFRIALNMAKITLSEQEFQLIKDGFPGIYIYIYIYIYTIGPNPGELKWKDFSDTIEQVFTIKGMEKRPHQEFVPAQTTYKYGEEGLTSQEEAARNDIGQRFGIFLLRQRLDAKSFFQEWDPHNSSKVSEKQFVQVLTSIGFKFDEGELESLIKYYKIHTTGFINYLKFIQDTKPRMAVWEEPEPEKREQPFPKDTTRPELNKLLQKIKNLVMGSRIRLVEFFQDHDPLRKGRIMSSKFRGVLDKLKYIYYIILYILYIYIYID